MNLEDSGEEVPIQLFEICLEREEFFPGEVVTGKLLVVTSRPLNTEGKPLPHPYPPPKKHKRFSH